MSLKDILSKYDKPQQQQSLSGNATLDNILKKYNKPSETQNNDSWTLDSESHLGSFINEGLAGLTGTYGGASRLIHADSLADWLQGHAQEFSDKNAIDAPGISEIVNNPSSLYEYVTNPHGLTRTAGQFAGSMAAIAPAMALLPESIATGALGIAARFGGNRAMQWLIDKGYTEAAKTIARNAPWMARYGTSSAAVESAAEGGGVRDESLAQGDSELEATARSLAATGLNLPLLMATNTLEAAALGSRFFKPNTGGSGFSRMLTSRPSQFAGRTALESGQNAVEEGAQYGISATTAGKDFDPNEFWRSWNEGAAGGIVLGGLGNSVQAIRGYRNDKRSTQSAGTTGGN